MKLTSKQAKEKCKVGQGKACCIYLTMSPTGWECAKSDKTIKEILTKKWKAGITNAKGIGDFKDCPFNVSKGE